MRAIATIHDDYGRMLAELPLAHNVNRLFTLSGRGAFSLDVPASDAGAALLSEGRTVVVWSQRLVDLHPYSAAVRALAPRGYWRLGEPSGTSAADSSVNGYTGTYAGSPTLGVAGLLQGDTDRAITGNGSNAGVTLPSLGAMANWSIAYWTKRGASTGRQYDRHFSTTGEVIEIAINYVNGKIKFLDAGGWTETAATLALGDLAFLCWTFDGTTLTLYKNGVSVYSAARGRALTAVASAIGYKIGDSEGVSDTLDEFAIFPTALSAPDVACLYAARLDRTLPAPCSPPYVGYISHIEEDTFDRVHRVGGDNRASVFYERNLPQDCKFTDQTAGSIAMRLLTLANSLNATGVYPSPVAMPGSPVRGTFDASGAKLGDALDELSDKTGDEWWLDLVVERNRITAYLAWGERGLDRSSSVVLEEGIHFTRSSYIRDVLGTAVSATAVGGTGAMPDRVASVRTNAPIGVNYGVALNREISEYLPLDEDEAVLSDAAAKMLERPLTAAETLTLTINSVLNWGDIAPGDIVRVLLPNAGAGGVDRHVRILAMQPDEAAGECDLAIEVL